MHLFQPRQVEEIAQGSELRSPAQVRAQIAAAHARPGLPIHLSEITISAPGEPSVSGLFHRDMTPKKSYFALDRLVNDEWRTRLTAKAGADGSVSFRGFRGRYRLSWRDASGAPRAADATLA